MSLESKLREKLKNIPATHLELVNESHLHEGHIPGHHTESHFRLVMVSEKFEGLSRVQRQRMIYDLFSAEFKEKLHALTMKLLTPKEFSGS